MPMERHKANEEEQQGHHPNTPWNGMLVWVSKVIIKFEVTSILTKKSWALQKIWELQELSGFALAATSTKVWKEPSGIKGYPLSIYSATRHVEIPVKFDSQKTLDRQM